MSSSGKIVSVTAFDSPQTSLTFPVIHPCSVAEPQRFVSVAYPSVPSGIRLRKTLEALINLVGRDMKLCDGWGRKRSQEWFSELEADFWNCEATAFQVANRKARRVEVYKVPCSSSTVDMYFCLVLTIQKMAVV